MSLEAQLNQAVSEEKLKSSSRDNILAMLAAAGTPLYRTTVEELVAEDAWSELNDRFYITLEFGTGGLRGRTIGEVVTKAERGNAAEGERPEHPCVGTNTMNFYNISRATRGLVAYIKAAHTAAGDSSKPSLVIAHDTRHFSADFAKFAAQVATDHGANVYLMDGQRPTPLMSYAVRTLRTDAGVMITASHNPAHDNGFKVNYADGAGIVGADARGIIKEVDAIASESYEPLHASECGETKIISKELEEDYLTRVETLMLRPELLEKTKGLKIVFTALHGTGGVFVPTLLKRLGFDLTTVPEQDIPDGHFPTVASPNPENAPALKMAADLADQIGAAAIIGTDPDCDRMGVGVRDSSGKMQLLTGNQTGILLAWYRIKTLFELGILNDSNKQNAVLLKTFVTSPMQDAVAHHFGIRCVNTLTGFKWISAKLKGYEEKLGIGDSYRDLSEKETRDLRLAKSTFLAIGTEESYGYMGSDFSRDKDGNGAVVMFAELAAYAASLGKTIIDVLDDIYSELGYYMEVNKSCFFEGAEGAAKIAKLADSYAANPPTEIDGVSATVMDFNKQTIHDEEGEVIPKAKMIIVKLADGRLFTVRPSGTEPKIKYYMFGFSGPASGSRMSAEELAQAKTSAKEGLDRLWTWIQADIETRLA